MFERLLDFLKELPGNGLRERGEKLPTMIQDWLLLP